MKLTYIHTTKYTHTYIKYNLTFNTTHLLIPVSTKRGFDRTVMTPSNLPSALSHHAPDDVL